ncbi:MULTISPECIES: ABC transporter permease [unclassified Nonomuraea]|uniref:ABC transporter permease n=1 Tax=unclassified Nonomuraea TaxID=2593643 RepID=UPI0033E6ECEF
MTRPSVMVASVALVLFTLVAFAPGLFASASPIGTDLGAALRGPSGAHWFGTDQLGRDVFARVLYGARSALLLALAATTLAVLGGTVLGLLSGLGGRAADQVLMRLADIFLALPPLLLALLVVAVMGAGTGTVALAVAAALIPAYGRVVRAEALVVRRAGYVEAAVGLGLPRPLLIVRHILPNSVGAVLALATVGFGTALLYASVLSFLGLGTKPPDPEWGSMLAEGREFLGMAWWIAVFPGAALTLVVIAVNVVGRYARIRFAGRTPL